MLTESCIRFSRNAGCDKTLVEFCELTRQSSEISHVPFHRELQEFAKIQGYVRSVEDNACWKKNCEIIHKPSIHAAQFMMNLCETKRNQEADDASRRQKVADNIAQHLMLKHAGDVDEAIADAAHTKSLQIALEILSKQASSRGIGWALAAAVDAKNMNIVRFLNTLVEVDPHRMSYEHDGIASHAAIRAAQKYSLDTVKWLIQEYRISAACIGRMLSVAIEQKNEPLESYLTSEFSSSCIDYDEALIYAARHHSQDTVCKILHSKDYCNETVSFITYDSDGNTHVREEFIPTRNNVCFVCEAVAESIERGEEEMTRVLFQSGYIVFYERALKHAFKRRMSEKTFDTLTHMQAGNRRVLLNVIEENGIEIDDRTAFATDALI